MHVPTVPILQLTDRPGEFACSRSYRDEIGIGKQGDAAPDPCFVHFMMDVFSVLTISKGQEETDFKTTLQRLLGEERGALLNSREDNKT